MTKQPEKPALDLAASFEADFAKLEEENSDALMPSGRLCTGLVFLTHGFDPGLVGEPDWTIAMQRDMIRRIHSTAASAVIKTHLDKNDQINFTIFWQNSQPGSSKEHRSCEYFIRLDWTPVANYLITGISTARVAKALAEFLLSESCNLPELAKLPIHLIGHSRGASLVCALAEQLGYHQIKIDHITTLDPHPLTHEDPQPPGQAPVIDTPVTKLKNVNFMDNYWQNISYPKGQPVEGAYNRLFTHLPGGYHLTIHTAFGDHMNTILAYHATINTASPLDTGDAVLKEQHRQTYFSSEEQKGLNTGFLFSRAVKPELRPRPAGLNRESAKSDNEDNNSNTTNFDTDFK